MVGELCWVWIGIAHEYFPRHLDNDEPGPSHERRKHFGDVADGRRTTILPVEEIAVFFCELKSADGSADLCQEVIHDFGSGVGIMAGL